MAKRALRAIYRLVPLKKQIFTIVRKITSPSSQVYQHLHFVGDFPVRIEEGYWMKMRHYGFQIENEIFWSGLDGGWERTSLRLWKKLVRQADVIFDIGANTGVYSLVAKSLNPAATVYALEPISRVFEKLLENRTLNDLDFFCLEVAASDADGTAVVFDTPTEHTYSVTVNENLLAHGEEAIPTEIQIIRLDTLINEQGIPKIDLMKIDVETHEPQVLAGLGKYLNEFRPTLLIEILTDDVGVRVQALVEGLDYLYFNIDEEKDSVRQVDKITKSDYYNYLLCTNGIARELGLLNE